MALERFLANYVKYTSIYEEDSSLLHESSNAIRTCCKQTQKLHAADKAS